MERERILRKLRADLAAAQHRRDDAAAHFNEIVRDVPSGIPIPDGAARIRIASNDYAYARAAATTALVTLNEFIVRGTVPLNLQTKPPVEE